MVIIKARNKIIAGEFKEYKFRKSFGVLYLQCLEKSFSVNAMTIQTISEIERMESPSLPSMLFRGYIFSLIFGWLGMIAGTSSANKKVIYKLQITFTNGGIGIAEVDDKIYEALLDVIINAQNDERF